MDGEKPGRVRFTEIGGVLLLRYSSAALKVFCIALELGYGDVFNM